MIDNGMDTNNKSESLLCSGSAPSHAYLGRQLRRYRNFRYLIQRKNIRCRCKLRSLRLAMWQLLVICNCSSRRNGRVDKHFSAAANYPSFSPCSSFRGASGGDCGQYSSPSGTTGRASALLLQKLPTQFRQALIRLCYFGGLFVRAPQL